MASVKTESGSDECQTCSSIGLSRHKILFIHTHPPHLGGRSRVKAYECGNVTLVSRTWLRSIIETRSRSHSFVQKIPRGHESIWALFHADRATSHDYQDPRLWMLRRHVDGFKGIV